MTHKSILVALTLCVAAGANAQDKLHKMNGETIEVKVKEVTAKEIRYKKADNADGPTYTIGKREVESIEYQNGSEDVFNKPEPRREAAKAEKLKYGKNILSISPMFIADGVGVGLSYERMLDRKGIVSFYLPAGVAIRTDDRYNYASPYYSGSGGYYYGGNTSIDYANVYIMPGVKIYPTGSKGKVRYAVGPNIAMVYGKTPKDGYLGTDPTTGYPMYGSYMADRFTLGVMVTNSLNLQPTPHLSLGMELGLGVSYINQHDGISQGETGLAQFSFRIGYRF